MNALMIVLRTRVSSKLQTSNLKQNEKGANQKRTRKQKEYGLSLSFFFWISLLWNLFEIDAFGFCDLVSSATPRAAEIKKRRPFRIAVALSFKRLAGSAMMPYANRRRRSARAPSANSASPAVAGSGMMTAMPGLLNRNETWLAVRA